MEEEQSFDIDAGVDAIAEGMGWDGSTEDNEEVIEDELQEETEAAEEVTEDPEEGTEEPEETTARAAPASWGKEHHETWAALPDQAKDYIELREKQMLDGIEQYKQGHATAQEFSRIVEPFNDMLKQFGASPVQALQNSLEWNRALTSGSLEQRQEEFVKLGSNLGIIPQEGQPQVDKQTFELQQRIDRMEREQAQAKQVEYQQNFQRVQQEVDQFANDPANEHFEAVADDVVVLLKTGIGLKDAYEKAVWANPVTRAKEIAKATEARSSELLAKKQGEAQKAIKAKQGNVKSVNTRRSPSEPTGSFEDTMREILQQIN